MTLYYEKPTEQLYYKEESDGYLTQKVEFDIDYDTFIEEYWKHYYKGVNGKKDSIDLNDFRFMVYEFDIDLKGQTIDDELIEELYFKYAERGN